MTATEPVWVPEACTLPTAEQPLRRAEFDGLFAASLRAVTTIGPTLARLELGGSPGLAASVRDLAARESSCCPFFGFTVTAEPAAGGERVTLEIRVPPQHADVLAALVRRAAGAGAAVADGRA